MTHTEDTVFLVFEPDYCVRKEDEEARQEFIRAVNLESAGVENLSEVGDYINDPAVKQQFEKEHEQYKADLKTAAASWGAGEVTWPFVPPGESSGSTGASSSDQLPGLQPKRVAAFGRSYAGDTDIAAPTKSTAPQSVTPEDCSQELLDMLHILAEAKRNGCGDLVWFGWDSSHWGPRSSNSKWRASAPFAGAHSYGLTAKGARFLLNKRLENDYYEAHMGTTLAYFLRQYQDCPPEEFGCCYLWPPVGNYISHTTTTNANVRDLNSHWEEAWCQGGTRKDEKHGHWWDRSLCHLTEKGPPKVIVEVKPENDESKYWKTESPPMMPDAFKGVQWWHKAVVMKDPWCLCWGR